MTDVEHPLLRDASPSRRNDPSIAGAAADPVPRRWADVPWRTIVASIAVVAGTLVAGVVIHRASRVLTWVSVAGFFAVVLATPVRAIQARCRVGRSVAVALVVSLTVVTLVGLGVMFLLPVRVQLVAALTDARGTVQHAIDGQGPLGPIVQEFRLEQLLRANQDRLNDALDSVTASLPSFISSALELLFAMVTIIVTTCLMLTQSATLSRAAINVVPPRHRGWVTEMAREAASAVSGYMIGNLVISVCAGLSAFVLLSMLGVPNAMVLSLWVAVADLVPLVGATLGAVVAVLAAFFVSPTAGIVALVFFVLYQQFENSVLQTVVMSRTVRVSPLVVLLSVLLGAELFGLVGALLAIPVAGATSVVIKTMWAHRQHPDALVVLGAVEPTATSRGRHTRRRRKVPDTGR